MKSLFLVHIEEEFRNHFPCGMLDCILRERHNFGEIVHFTSGISAFYHFVDELLPIVTKEVDWGWGYEPECCPNDEKEFLISSNGHEWTWIPPYLRKWEGAVVLGGGKDGECLSDMEAILNHLEIPWQRNINFIY